MKGWLLRCCCCGDSTKEKATTLDDTSSLVSEGQLSGAPTSSEVQAFYVPRRHSSFNASTYKIVSAQPVRSHSDSCSSSDDDEFLSNEQRTRCWSTIPGTSATDVTSLLNHKSAMKREVNSFSHPKNLQGENSKNAFAFDKHVLSEISETEPGIGEETASIGDEDNPKGDAEVCGYVTFSTAYDENEQKLSVFLEAASDLPKKGSLVHYSTFVKLGLTTSRKNFRLSRAVKNSLNPVYKEEHTFDIAKSKWKSAKNDVLKLSLYDVDRQGRHDAIGHVVLPLNKMNKEKEQHHLPLTPMSIIAKNIGQILTGLYYSAKQSKLSIHVIKARHLRLDPEIHKRHLRPLAKEIYDTFAKVTLMCGGQKVKTDRSRVVFDTCDPFYNHKSNFVVPAQFLLDSSIVVTVVAKGILGRSIPLGRITAGPYTETSNGIPTHWGRMVQETRSVVKWRNLYL